MPKQNYFIKMVVVIGLIFQQTSQLSYAQSGGSQQGRAQINSQKTQLRFQKAQARRMGRHEVKQKRPVKAAHRAPTVSFEQRPTEVEWPLALPENNGGFSRIEPVQQLQAWRASQPKKVQGAVQFIKKNPVQSFLIFLLLLSKLRPILAEPVGPYPEAFPHQDPQAHPGRTPALLPQISAHPSEKNPGDVVCLGRHGAPVGSGEKQCDAALLPLYHLPPLARKQPVAADEPGSMMLGKLYEQALKTDKRLKDVALEISHEIPGAFAAFPPGLKGVPRTLEKVSADYAGDFSQISDLTRASLVFKNEEDLYEGLRQFSKKMYIVKMKDRFEAPLSSGYRDINVLFRDPKNGHMGEMQFHLESIFKVKDHAHELYEEARSIEARAAIEEGRSLTAEESARIDELLDQQKRMYTNAYYSHHMSRAK